MLNRARNYVEQSQQYIKDGQSNDFIKMIISENDIKARLRMISFNGIYDSNPKLKFLEKAKPIEDRYTIDMVNNTNTSIQCFDIGSRKVIKVYIVASHNGYSFYKEKDLNKMIRNYHLEAY